MGNKHIVFVVYDGIKNSVFKSQVLQPLIDMIDKSQNLEITLISFEKNKIDAGELLEIIPARNRLHVIFGKRLPFFGQLSLLFAAYQLKNILQRLDCHQVIARGPLAGFIVLWALGKIAKKFPERLRNDTQNPMPDVVFQARGLCAEEYRYAKLMDSTNFLTKFFHRMLYSSLKNIEFVVYRNKRKTDYPNDAMIEAVSPALREYLVEHFRADPSKIIIAINDLPKTFDKNQVLAWRQEVRKQLGIPDDWEVYCYSGSYKPWQCAEQTVKYVASRLKDDQKIFFLILTPDKNKFIEECAKQNIAKQQYAVLNVGVHDVYKYLAVGDHGLLFREPDVVNWVSRPTKMLEYQSVGLKIIHNGTIAWLKNEPSNI